MIESYLRANKMFVDYSEVMLCIYFSIGYLYHKCLEGPLLSGILHLYSLKWRECTHRIWNSILRM